MIGRRRFITGLMASAAMPMLVDQHRVVLVGMDFGREPAMAEFVLDDRNKYILVSTTFKRLFDEQLARITA